VGLILAVSPLRLHTLAARCGLHMI
jgi:hypothetical protein